MGATHRTVRRFGTIVAAAAAISIAGATAASAHHCYKEEWSAAAHQAQMRGNTPWMPLSDLGAMFIIGEDYVAQCGYVADEAVAAWMADTGKTQEPLIHTKATIGSGSFYKKGVAPKPINYLNDDDFMHLTLGIIEGMATCAPEWEMPSE